MVKVKEVSHTVFINETSNWIVQLIRYIFVGGIAFFVDFGLLYVCTEYGGLYYLLSATISFIAGLIVNYFLSTKWIFTKSKISNSYLEFLIYGIIGVIGLLINDFVMYLFTDVVNIHYMVSKLITAIIVMGWNFIGRRSILFN